MVCTGIEVGPHPVADRVVVPPCHERVDEAVAPTIGELVLGPAEADQVVAVVLQTQVARGVRPCELACPDRVGLRHDGVLHRQQALGTEELPGLRRVLGRNEVGVRSGSARGEPQHARPQRGQDDRRRMRRARRFVRRGAEPLEVGLHRPHGRGVGLASHLLDQRAVAHAEPDDQTVRERLADGGHRGCRCHRIASPDAGHARAHGDAVRAAEQERGVGEGLLAPRLGDPDRAVAEAFDLGRGRRSLRRRQLLQREREHADRAERRVDQGHRRLLSPSPGDRG